VAGSRLLPAIHADAFFFLLAGPLVALLLGAVGGGFGRTVRRWLHEIPTAGKPL
jgi:hypothetical protein